MAPLDVLKIRLQLQIHSLSDPLSTRTTAGKIRPSTVNTFKEILVNEGVTVRFHINELTYTAETVVTGLLEGQYSRRASLSRIRRHPILHL